MYDPINQLIQDLVFYDFFLNNFLEAKKMFYFYIFFIFQENTDPMMKTKLIQSHFWLSETFQRQLIKLYPLRHDTRRFIYINLLLIDHSYVNCKNRHIISKEVYMLFICMREREREKFCFDWISVRHHCQYQYDKGNLRLKSVSFRF